MGVREKQGTWIVEYSTGERTESGRLRTTIETFQRKKDADERWAEIKVAMGKGVHVSHRKSITVKEAGEQFVTRAESLGRERTSLDSYRQHLRLHINPVLGHVKLTELTVATCAAWQQKLLDKKLSLAMARKVSTTLSSVIKFAMQSGKVAHNVMDNTANLEGSNREVLRVGVDIPTREDVDAMLGAIAPTDTRTRALMLVAARTGLRASELRGLRWSDVDLEAAELTVGQRADRYGVVGAPKSKRGSRTLPLPGRTVLALKEWKVASLDKTGLVFPGANGGPIHYNTMVNFTIVPAWKAGGVHKPFIYHVHSLRHFAASVMLLDAKLPLLVVSRRLGHASIKITADTYGHLLPTNAAADELAAMEGKHG